MRGLRRGVPVELWCTVTQDGKCSDIGNINSAVLKLVLVKVWIVLTLSDVVFFWSGSSRVSCK